VSDISEHSEFANLTTSKTRNLVTTALRASERGLRTKSNLAGTDLLQEFVIRLVAQIAARLVTIVHAEKVKLRTKCALHRKTRGCHSRIGATSTSAQPSDGIALEAGGTESSSRAAPKTSQGRHLFTNLLARRELYGLTPHGLHGVFSMTTTAALFRNR
jgi:hypothetical protein